MSREVSSSNSFNSYTQREGKGRKEPYIYELNEQTTNTYGLSFSLPHELNEQTPPPPRRR